MTSFVDDNGNYLDFSGDVGLTKQCANFFDFKIKGDVSVTLKLDNNSQNRKVLGYYGPQQTPFFSKVAFSMVRDGNILSKGSIVIRESDEKTISAFYISGNSNWFQSFQFNLKDIAFDDRLTVLLSDFDGRKSATEGIVFPLIDWYGRGYRRSGGVVKINPSFSTEEGPVFSESHPCLYLHSIVDYMSEYAGVKISGDLLSDNLYNKIIITPDGPDYYAPDVLIDRTYARIQNGPFGSAAAGVYDFTLDPQPIRFQTLIEGAGQIDTSLYAWYVPITGTYRIDLDFWINNLDQYDVKLLVNDAIFTTMFNQSLGVNNKIGTAFVNLRKGDKVTFTVANTLAANYRLDVLSQQKFTNFSIKLEKVAAITPAGNLGGYSAVDTVGYIIPNMIVPDMLAIDLIKFLASYFACSVSYDEYSGTIFLNKISAFKRETARNWSEYLVKHKTKWDNKVAANNFIQTEEGTEPDIEAYNAQSLVRYGGGNIETDFDAIENKDLFTIPFSGSWDERNKSYLKIFTPFIKFYEVEVGQGVAYSAVASGGGGGLTLAAFTATFNEPMSQTDVFYIVSDSGVYTGFGAYWASSSALTNPTLTIPYVANDAGTIYRCTVSKVQGKNRMLICEAGRSLAEIGGTTITPTVASNPGTSISVGPLVWYDKPKVLLPIDSYHESLAIDSNKANANDISERFFGPIKRAFNSPLTEAEFNLPRAEFQNFDFDEYVYIETKDLVGYFLVQKIENYKDALTPCKVEMLNG